MKKILVVLGPTATGKSDLAVQLAKQYNGEVISADSRQVYKGLNIGTGKITKKEMRGVTHHLLDIASPKKVFTIAEWKKKTDQTIQHIHSKGKLPIVCGGTGFYIQSIVENITLPEVPPNKKLRKDLGLKNIEELKNILKKLDSARLENIDIKNPVRLIRAIEVATALGKVPKIKKQKNPYAILQIGLDLSDAELKTKIHARLLARIKKGMILEAQNLKKSGLSYKRMRELGLEYRYLADFLEHKINKSELIKKLDIEIWHYVKRQRTWFKRDKTIKWFSPDIEKGIDAEIQNFLTSK